MVSPKMLSYHLGTVNDLQLGFEPVYRYSKSHPSFGPYTFLSLTNQSVYLRFSLKPMFYLLNNILRRRHYQCCNNSGLHSHFKVEIVA